jgi:uncharacterized membrane protein
MDTFEAWVIIEKPVEKVFEYATDFNKIMQWQTSLKTSHLTSSGTTQKGATYYCLNTFLGKRIETEGRITAYELNKKCSFKTTSGPIKAEHSLIFEPTSEGTRVTAVGVADFSSFSLAKRLVARKAKKQLQNDLTKLKYILEAED